MIGCCLEGVWLSTLFMQFLESSEMIWFLKCCLNCKIMLLSGMCSQRVRKLTLNLVEPPRFVCPIFFFFPRRSLRILNKLSCSWHVGAGKGRSVGSVVSFLHLRNSLSWCHKKKQNLTSMEVELLFHALIDNYTFYTWVSYCCCFSCQTFLNAFRKYLLNAFICGVGGERWIVKDQGGSPVDSEVPHLVCIYIEKKKGMLIPHTWII